ncbi:glycosyltransferase family 25 protein [Boseaceae bacterium BT-24-1]|nr:glycosyltransferase family 25 protein [Boseaceae bacterium BT-24-1]
MLQLVPKPDIAFDGDSAQAVGIDLPVAVINIPHRTDKWNAISKRMAAIGLNKLIKVPAVEGARLSLEAIAPVLCQPAAQIEAAPQSHFTLTRPAIGCFLSHIATWQWLIANKMPRLLVFEDDANPAASFDANRFRNVLGAIPPKAGLVFLGRAIMNGMAERPQGSELARIYFFNGTFAYLITPAACRTLIPALLPMNGHIDHEISTVLIERRHDLEAHYTEPPIFEPDWSLRSDCYVPLEGVTNADRALGIVLHAKRQLLIDDGCALLPPFDATAVN